MDTPILRLLIHRKIDEGSLPHDRMPHVWDGPGNGETCDGCGDTVTTAQMIMEGCCRERIRGAVSRCLLSHLGRRAPVHGERAANSSCTGFAESTERHHERRDSFLSPLATPLAVHVASAQHRAQRRPARRADSTMHSYACSHGQSSFGRGRSVPTLESEMPHPAIFQSRPRVHRAEYHPHRHLGGPHEPSDPAIPRPRSADRACSAFGRGLAMGPVETAIVCGLLIATMSVAGFVLTISLQ